MGEHVSLVQAGGVTGGLALLQLLPIIHYHCHCLYVSDIIKKILILFFLQIQEKRYTWRQYRKFILKWIWHTCTCSPLLQILSSIIIGWSERSTWLKLHYQHQHTWLHLPVSQAKCKFLEGTKREHNSLAVSIGMKKLLLFIFLKRLCEWCPYTSPILLCITVIIRGWHGPKRKSI